MLTEIEKEQIDKIITLICRCDIHKIKHYSNLIDDLDFENIYFDELRNLLNQYFNTSIKFSDINKINTVGDVYKIVERKIK